MSDVGKITKILDFWFEGINDDTPIDRKASPFNKWFKKNGSFDCEIKKQFEADLVTAKEGGYKDWEKTITGRLALVILFDQFSRNIYRDTPKMFEQDTAALKLSLHTLTEKKDRELSLIQRQFLYMPLMHAEGLNIQELSLKCFGLLVEESKNRHAHNTPYYQYTLEYARKHHRIIERFGRFSHRNAILKRTSTSEEEEFLQQPGAPF